KRVSPPRFPPSAAGRCRFGEATGSTSMKLTDDIVAGLELPPGKAEFFAWDDTLPGFGVRLRAGTKRWYVQYRVGRQQRRESLGDVRKIEIQAARKIA